MSETRPRALTAAEQQLQAAGFKPDYLEVRHAANLSIADAPKVGDKLVILGAAFLGKARLIDNISVTLITKND